MITLESRHIIISSLQILLESRSNDEWDESIRMTRHVGGFVPGSKLWKVERQAKTIKKYVPRRFFSTPNCREKRNLAHFVLIKLRKNRLDTHFFIFAPLTAYSRPRDFFKSTKRPASNGTFLSFMCLYDTVKPMSKQNYSVSYAKFTIGNVADQCDIWSNLRAYYKKLIESK